MKDGGDLGAAREACPGGVLSAFGQPMTDDSQPPEQLLRGWLGVLSSVPRGGSDSAMSTLTISELP